MCQSQINKMIQKSSLSYPCWVLSKYWAHNCNYNDKIHFFNCPAFAVQGKAKMK